MLEKNCCMGVPLYPQATGRQMRPLIRVSGCFHAALLPSAFNRMVLAYTYTYVHTCRLSYTFSIMPRSARVELHVFLVNYQQTFQHVYLCVIFSVTWFVLCLEKPPPLFFVFFPVSIFSIEEEKPQIKYLFPLPPLCPPVPLTRV